MRLTKRLLIFFEFSLFCFLLLFFWHWIPFLVLIILGIAFVVLGGRFFKEANPNV